MKELKFNKQAKLAIKIGLALLWVLIFVLLVVRATSKTTDSLGNEIIEINNIAFYVFSRPIYFYALSIVTGIVVAYVYALNTASKIGFKEDNLYDGFIWGALIGILGARIYYAIFSWDSFKDNPLKIITGFFEGAQGLAIHGAIIGAGLFAYFFCKKRKEDFLTLGEMLAPGFLIGQIFGRWGNFFNKEAHGGPIADTVLKSREFLDKLPIPKFVVDQMYIYENGITTYMHPTFLYESVWNLIGLTVILVVRKKWKKYYYGDAVLYYLVWYGLGRFMIESLRTDALMMHFFGIELRTAQVVSSLMIIAGVVLFILRRVFKYKPISYIEMEERTKNGSNI